MIIHPLTPLLLCLTIFSDLLLYELGLSATPFIVGIGCLLDCKNKDKICFYSYLLNSNVQIELEDLLYLRVRQSLMRIYMFF